MFTGIIEEIGRLQHVTKIGQAMRLTIQAQLILEDVHLGDSISINGVCLTVTEFSTSHFTMDVMPETFRKTTLHLLSVGSKVNLERAMQANGRFGGHIVQGHVDGTGIIRQRKVEENAVVFTIEPVNTSLFRYMIDHGSITLDGISLTIVKVQENTLTVSIIPHTLAQTVLQERQIGDMVNIECDVLGKYVERLLQFNSNDSKESSITAEFLTKTGFM